MKTEITTELLQAIYNRATEYATAKEGNAPDRIIISEDGSIQARYDDYRCGSYDYTDTEISAENLTEDLDVVAEQRRIKLEEDRLKQLEYNRQQERLRNQRDAENRRQQYLKLKKEFGE